MHIARVVRDDGSYDFAIRDPQRSDSWAFVRDLGLTVEDTASVIEQWPQLLAGLEANEAQTHEVAPPQLKNPVVRPGKILAIGLNYADHIAETGSATPAVPVVFAKYPSSLNGPYEPVLINSDLTVEGDYESELAVVIGKTVKNVAARHAHGCIFGYAVANDVSARDWQRKDPQFSRSKSFDTFCPVGPWITTSEAVPAPQSLPIRSWVNGELRQDSSTEQMIFSIANLIEYLSSTMTLHPGDVILTGTPHGVGIGHKPPKFIVPGDLVECEVGGLGRIANRVVADLSEAI